MIYGATGYSLGLAATAAKRASLNFIIGGRSPSKVQALAHSLGVDYRVFSPTSPTTEIDAAITGLTLFINGAGPFQQSTLPFMDACIRSKVHYIDISAELDSFRAGESRDEDARRAGVMLVPAGAAGIEVVLDCLAGRVIERTPKPVKVGQVLNINGLLSRGTVATIRSSFGGAFKRVDGELVPHQTPVMASYDFGDGRGALECFPSNDPQILTVWRATGVQNISSVCCKTGGDIPEGNLKDLPTGPSADERAETPYHAAVVVQSEDGTIRSAIARLPNGYDLVAIGAVQAMKTILGDPNIIKPGFQTPYQAFGSGYLNGLTGVEVTDL